jgi:hypothetical protein
VIGGRLGSPGQRQHFLGQSGSVRIAGAARHEELRWISDRTAGRVSRHSPAITPSLVQPNDFLLFGGVIVLEIAGAQFMSDGSFSAVASAYGVCASSSLRITGMSRYWFSLCSKK